MVVTNDALRYCRKHLEAKGRNSSDTPLDKDQWEKFEPRPVPEAPLPPLPEPPASSAGRGGGYLTPSPGAASQLLGAPRRAHSCCPPAALKRRHICVSHCRQLQHTLPTHTISPQ